MKLKTAFEHVARVFLDTAPVIYYVERNSPYFELTTAVFDGIDDNRWHAVTSPITLAEALVIPHQRDLTQLQRDFTDLIVSGNNTTCFSIDWETGREAAKLRAKYNLTLMDAIQISVALQTNCDVFLTNDARLSRVTEINVLLLADLEM